MDKYHENIRTIRRRKGLTQEEIAEAMHIQRSTYGRFERGETHLLTPNARRFLKATGLSLEEFLEFHGKITDGYLSEATVNDRIYEILDELRDQREILNRLNAKIDGLGKNK